MEREEQVTRWRILKDTVVNEQKSNIYILHSNVTAKRTYS